MLHVTCQLYLIYYLIALLILQLNDKPATRLLHNSETVLSCYESLHEIFIKSLSNLAQNMASALLPYVIASLFLGCQVVNFVRQLSISWCQYPHFNFP